MKIRRDYTIDIEVVYRLEQLAKKLDVSMSSILNQALIDELDKTIEEIKKKLQS